MKLSINNPCLENWNNMDKTTKGAFCHNCQKEVIDFSKLSDNEIVSVIETRTGSVCGKFNNTQLNRDIHFVNYQVNHQPSFYKLFIALFLSAFWSNSTEAKSTDIKSQISINPILKNGLGVNKKDLKKDSNKVVIKVKVLDKETNEPIPFVNVFIKDVGFGMTTDIDGVFSLSVPDSLFNKPFTLKIGSSIEFNQLEITNISKEKASTEMIYYLEKRNVIIMGALINTVEVPKKYTKKKWWERKQK